MRCPCRGFGGFGVCVHHPGPAVQTRQQLDISRGLVAERQVEQGAHVDLVPRHAREDVRLVLHRPPFPPVPDHERGQQEIAGRLPIPLALLQGDRRAGSRRPAFGVGDDPALQVVQALQAEPLADLLQKIGAPALEAEDVAFIQPGNAGLPRVRLAEDAADELGQRALRAGVCQDGEDVGERAVPAFLQRLLGDDEPHGALARQQAAGLVHLLQLVLLAGLDGDQLLADAGMAQQVVPDVLGVHHARPPLVPARALHLDEADGTDVDARVRLVRPGLLLEPLPVLDGGEQRVLPSSCSHCS